MILAGSHGPGHGICVTAAVTMPVIGALRAKSLQISRRLPRCCSCIQATRKRLNRRCKGCTQTAKGLSIDGGSRSILIAISRLRGLRVGWVNRETWRTVMDYWLYRDGVRHNIGSEDAYVHFDPDFPQTFKPIASTE